MIPTELKQQMAHFGHHIEEYSDTFLERRLKVRLRALGIEEISDYMKKLDPREAKLYFDELFINVTNLFRDVTPFMALKEQVLPKLPTRPLIWSAGCSMGCEAVSLKVVCMELGISPRILCSDNDPTILDQAKRFTYPKDFMREVPAPYMKYFEDTGENFKAKPEVTNDIRFEQNNILTMNVPDASLICCRNTVIYFNAPTKEKFYEKIFNSVKPGTYFMLGKTETLIGAARSMFTTVDASNKIYLKP